MIIEPNNVKTKQALAKQKSTRKAKAIIGLLCGLAVASHVYWSHDNDGGDIASWEGIPTDAAGLVVSQATGDDMRGLLTVKEIKERMMLPCNYVMDGRYLDEGNEIVNQNYQTILNDASLLKDDDIPVIVECGGHDGITKSLSLKSRVCLNMKTLLIEASPENFSRLRKSRPYDRVVNKALCDGDYVEIQQNKENAGMTKVAEYGTLRHHTSKINCTTIDAELDAMARDLLPEDKRNKLKLAFLVLDIEGHELIATKGIQKYSPMKMIMEDQFQDKKDRKVLETWKDQHKLVGYPCFNLNSCYNFDPTIQDHTDINVLYGARKVPVRYNQGSSKVYQAHYFMTNKENKEG